MSFFTTDLFEGLFPRRYYRPLVAASFAVEYAAMGKSALLYHLDNVLLHAMVCALFLGPVRRLFASDRMAFVAAALFTLRGSAALVATLGLAFLGLRSWKATPAMAFGSLFLLAGVLPLAFVLPFLEMVLVERFLYLPSLGFCLLAGAGLLSLEGRGVARGAVLGLIALLLVAGVGRSLARNPEWRDWFPEVRSAVAFPRQPI